MRKSTDLQKYSTKKQKDAIRLYADGCGIEIIRTYDDEGRSGLSMIGRSALKQLLSDVEFGEAAHAVILVYDVSRWSRFQDADESAYFEYVAGATVSMFSTAQSNSRMTAP